jgi:cadmium resistance protein CadD (predicted permease)
MIANFFTNLLVSIGSWILGLIVVVIVCIIAFPIGCVGYALNQGITKHSQINSAIEKAKREGHFIDWNKVNNFRASANEDLKGGYVGMGIMGVIYFLIFIFVPKFFLVSLWGLLPFGLGLCGSFMIPDI